MNNFYIKTLALIMALTFALDANADSGDENFCFNGDIPEAQMNMEMMCLTAPILFCPPTYFGCPTDNLDPAITGMPTVMPGDANCPTPIVTYTDNITTNTSCLKVVHRTWEATYPAGSASIKLHSSCQQTLYLEDSEAPIINNCPSDIIIDLTADCDSTAIWAVPTVTENCDLLLFTTTHYSGSSFSSGTTQVTYNATDRCGLTSQCVFNVTVTGSCCTAPSISCPPMAATCPVTGDTSTAATGTASATPTDASCGAPVITFQDNITSTGPCNGAMTIQRVWTANDASDSSQSSSCTQIIEVSDDTAPVLSNVPNDITVSGNGNGCDVQVFWTQPIATDNCGVNTLTSNFDSGAFFSAGTTAIVYTVVDNCGLSATASFLVTVNCLCDADPVITCPANYVDCPSGSYPDPLLTGTATATAGSSLCATPIVDFTDQVISSGPCASEYEIIRTWTASDPSNNSLSVSCTQTISLEDNGAPTITNVPSDITLYKKGSHCAMPVTWTPPTYSDDCTLTSTGSSIPNGSDFTGGTTTVIFTAVDVCGNVATASFNVTVECNTCDTPPAISCPPAYTSCPGGFIPSPAISGQPNVNDQGGTCGPSIVYHSDAITGFGNCAGSFYVDRTWTAFDQYNPALTSTCIQTISIDDTTAPTITGAPSNINLSATGNNCQLSVNWTAPTVTDDCGIDSFTSTHNPNDIFSEGTTTVTYTATDNCGNVSTTSFTVTITCQACNTPPSITCPANYTACPGGSTDPAVTGFAAGVISGTNCTGSPIVAYTDFNPTSTSCPNAVVIERTWTATNSAYPSLTASCVQTIQLIDNTPPTFTFVPNNISLSGNGSNCSMVATWATPTATDNCGNVTITSSHISGQTFSEGQTTISYTAVDACGNSVSASFIVTVSCAECVTPPSISCPSNVIACPGSSSDPAVTGVAFGSISGPNCSGNPIITFTDLNPTTTSCPNSEFIERTWTATNPSNSTLTVSCVQTIQFIDNTAPTFTFVPSDIFITGSGSATNCWTPVSWSQATAIDDCGNVSLTSSHASGSNFDQGQTTVTLTATDGCGNISTASFVVTVTCAGCATPPTINCPADYSACPGTSSDPSVTGFATGSISGPNCSGIPIITYTDLNPTSTACADAEYIERTWTATNPNDPSLTASCIQFITLADDVSPVISNIPNNITVTGTGTACAVNVSWSEPTATDNCNLTFFEGSHVSGAAFSEGITTVTYTANDSCGNTVDATFTVTVVCAAACNTAPSITCPSNYTTCPTSGVPPTSISGSAVATAGSSACGSPVVTFADVIVSTGPCPSAKVINRTFTATDPNNANLATSCVQVLSLVDNTAPVFASCPADIILLGTPNTGSGSGCLAIANWTLPIVSDNCGSVSLQAQTSSGQNVNSGATFFDGTTQVIYTATDACGNTSTCEFDVTVECNGNSGSSLSCPADITVPCGGNGGATVHWSAPSYSGSCGSCNGTSIPGFIYMGSFGGSEYYCSTNTANWANANQICQDNGGFLACINSQEENAYLANLLTLQSAWIGLNDSNNDGQFEWGCGDPLDYTNWYPGQPNNYNGSQDCVEMLNNGQWNDQYPYYLLEFIMEKPCSFVNQIAGPTSGTFLTGGTYVVTYETSDVCGPVETCSFNVVVQDGLSLTCPEDIVTSAPANSQGVAVNWNIPEVSSCCSDCTTGGGFIPGFVYMGSQNGHHYYCSTAPATWDDAQANCVASGGHLAVINNSAENTYLANILALQSAWIGANDTATEGTFQWVNGDPFSYTNWYPGQPNNYNGAQHHVEMLNNGQWNDQYGFYALEYIMEIESCLSLSQTAGPAPGSVLPPGSTHTVTYTAADGCGNVETCSFDITVESETAVCNPGGQNSSCHYIQECVFGALNNISGDNGGYADFTSQCTGAGPTDGLSIKLVPGFGGCAAQTVYWTIWIDYNMDGDFYDSNEFAAYGSGVNTLNGIVTMPKSLNSGESTIRIIMSQGGYVNDPCLQYPNGETEDYCIQFAGAKIDPNRPVAESKSLSANKAVELSESVSEELENATTYTVSVYPNPVSELMTIETNDTEYISSIQLYAPDGRVARDVSFNANDKMIEVNVSDLPTGMYNLATLYQDGQVITKRIIIQN
jgi:hypothetical protein